MENLELFESYNIVKSDTTIHFSIDIGATAVITTLCDRYIKIKETNKYTNKKSEVTCLACKKRKSWRLI